MSSVTSSGFQIWKTVKVGPGIADDFRQRIVNEAGLAVIPEETEFDLVKVTVSDLGFKEGVRHDRIYVRAKEFGLELCPPEVGHQLQLQYDGPPDGKPILVGMEPVRLADILGYGGRYLVYCLGDWNFTRYLLSPGHVWDLDDQWVFVLPHK
ncbi:MAG: hypothetical protein A2998_00350 [Candidatus Staskawiczbacteria bacterium RIFCSPLOWO2_01_FULL_37_25b]|uniref:Uncharacterized protein n=2 Tax=Candidatus Staskawicziibacteriota TaxID=1817916 RepID=A0A1G2HNW3_9BACT|nr:MAG: hypothetical protein A2812_03480 [Candidatus Staskawiczbacteria bacterium RIFCSPHIGHO2_01_FULL_36_16]OGZ71673.1 MAG: hypothetical protein A2998_00350 [Candidatus Staskawiczbacteria bacterium RIFCSPLOWO2_01_FULL_37_25b]